MPCRASIRLCMTLMASSQMVYTVHRLPSDCAAYSETKTRIRVNTIRLREMMPLSCARKVQREVSVAKTFIAGISPSDVICLTILNRLVYLYFRITIYSTFEKIFKVGYKIYRFHQLWSHESLIVVCDRGCYNLLKFLSDFDKIE